MAWAFVDDFVTAYNFGMTDPRGYAICRNTTGSSSNYGNSSTFDYFEDTAEAGHYLYIACGARYWGIKFYVGTAFVADSVEFAWEYCVGGDNWASLPVVNPNAFLSTGEQIVSFTPPPNWKAVGSEKGGWAIRCRIVSVTGISEGGANSTNVPAFNFKSLRATGTETSLSNAYIADLAGSYELLSATPGSSLVPLEMPTNEIIESAMLDVILLNTSAGTGDTVVLTGTNVEGNVQTETIDVSSGDGTYTTTKFFRSLTLVECNGFNDGTIKVIQKRWGIISQKINQYALKTHLLVGDGTTSTTLTLTSLHLSFCPGMFWRVYNNATFQSGTTTGSGKEYEGSYGGCSFYESINSTMGMGPYWKRLYTGATAILRGCNFFINSTYNPTRVYVFNGGSLTLQDCHFHGDTSNLWLISNIPPALLKRVYISGYQIYIRYIYTVLTGFKTNTVVSVEINGYGTNLILDSCSFAGIKLWPYQDSKLTLIDCPGMSRSRFSLGHNSLNNDDCVFIQYRLDMKVQDSSEATPIENANVTITNVKGEVVFSGQTDTNGNIAQQVLTYEKADWIGNPTSFVWEYHTPHTVTISKPGYQTKTTKYTMDRKREEVEVLEQVKDYNFSKRGKMITQ